MATEFSFFLAIPTLIGASVLEVFKVRHELAGNWHEYLPLFAVGFIVSFLAAWVCVRWLLRYVSTHTFVPFAWYRIAFGIVVLATWMTHMVTGPTRSRAERRVGMAWPTRVQRFVNTRSQTPWPSLMPRFSNFVSGRQSGRGA